MTKLQRIEICVLNNVIFAGIVKNSLHLSNIKKDIELISSSYECNEIIEILSIHKV